MFCGGGFLRAPTAGAFSASTSADLSPPQHPPKKARAPTRPPPLKNSNNRKSKKSYGALPPALCKAIRPPGFGSPTTWSPQKAPLEDLSVCYPRLRQVAFGMYMPRFNADVQMQKEITP